jgi:hypothetical protein
MKAMNNPPPITPLEFGESDFDKAEALAKALGYEQTAYTSTSALWGLFCLPENPEHSKGPIRGGCIIKTKQFGLLFVQDTEDITGEMEAQTLETLQG